MKSLDKPVRTTFGGIHQRKIVCTFNAPSVPKSLNKTGLQDRNIQHLTRTSNKSNLDTQIHNFFKLLFTTKEQAYYVVPETNIKLETGE